MKISIGSIGVLALLAVAGSNVSFAASKSGFHDDMRRLWEDHVAWTRLYIVSAVAGAPDKDATAQRLLRNQEDIGRAVAEFYGPAAGDRLTALLKDHILIAADLVGAAKAGDQAKTADAQKRWYANANEIASVLHSANPKNWPLATLQSMMKTHLDQTTVEATDQIQGRYEGSAKEYDQIEAHILEMADALSNGTVAQFPQKFRGE
jgi:hypothetical protein